MNTLTFRTHGALRCPQCKKPLARIRREGWMRWLPLSRHLDCAHCETRYLRFPGLTLGPL